MPSLPQAQEAAIPQLDSLAPRDHDDASLAPRSPAIEAAAADNPYARNALNALAERSNLESRQIVTGIIPSYYTTGGPAAGTVAGIVLGSVAGFLMLIWLFYSLANIGNPAFGRSFISGEDEIVVRRRRNSQSGRSRRSTRTEVREYSRSPRRRDTVIVEERRHSRPQRARSIVVEERTRRVPGDNIVEVIDESDDYSSRRGSRR
jgi:hypothetical protein